MKILVTGSNGFIAKNLIQFLAEKSDVEVLTINRQSNAVELESSVLAADWIVHLAGVNRPLNEQEFIDGNVSLTQKITQVLKQAHKQTPIILSSSIQAELDNAYGQSKLGGEQALLELHQQQGNLVYICRLANVFGKWSRPNYNSAVATFCYNTAHDLPIQIHDENALIRLVYVDDVIESFWNIIQGTQQVEQVFVIQPEYQISVGKLAKTLAGFKHSRETLITDRVGTGLTRALYSTYLSFLKPEQFDYSVPKYGDQRGVFVEMLKTPDAGQFSYFTAHPGITRGGHYHHTKTEKFLVIKGSMSLKLVVMNHELWKLCQVGPMILPILVKMKW